MVIDEEFKNLIPPLSEDEFKQLEENILHDGLRDDLVAWRCGEDLILIDGHNRYSICEKHGIKYGVHIKYFGSRDDAKSWMIDNQLGKRNVSKVDRIMLAEKKSELIQQKAKENQVKAGKEYGKGIAVVQMDKTYQNPIHTREEIAKIAGVGAGTVARVQHIQKNAPEKIEEIRKGDITINQAYRMTLPATAIKPKSVRQEAREEHKAFESGKENKAVTFTEIIENKKNEETLGDAMFIELVDLANKVINKANAENTKDEIGMISHENIVILNMKYSECFRAVLKLRRLIDERKQR